MPKNNFKLFDENKANMMSDADYNINQQRLNGVQSGVASSQLQNKTLYQTALMCYALAQLMAANGYDANDANAVSTFVNNLSLSMVQKVVDKASLEDILSENDNKWVSSAKLFNFLKNYPKFEFGTYVGNGLSGPDNPTVLTFNINPILVYITKGISVRVNNSYSILYTYPTKIEGASSGINIKAENKKLIYSAYSGGLSNGAQLQANESNVTYNYVCFGT